MARAIVLSVCWFLVYYIMCPMVNTHIGFRWLRWYYINARSIWCVRATYYRAVPLSKRGSRRSRGGKKNCAGTYYGVRTWVITVVTRVSCCRRNAYCRRRETPWHWPRRKRYRICRVGCCRGRSRTAEIRPAAIMGSEKRDLRAKRDQPWAESRLSEPKWFFRLDCTDGSRPASRPTKSARLGLFTTAEREHRARSGGGRIQPGKTGGGCGGIS